MGSLRLPLSIQHPHHCFPALQALSNYILAADLDPYCKLAFSNQAAALLKLERYGEAVQAATQARTRLPA